MNQIINHTEKQVEKINPNDVSGALKGLVPRSFEKTFNGLTTKQVEYAFSLCIQGLTREQIAIGMNAVVENGYCPDPAMFRKWCLGIKGFINDVDPVASSYKGKYAALNDVYTWISSNHKTEITEASFLAYQKSHSAFSDLKWMSNYEKAKNVADRVFMDNYDEVVKELVQQGIKQEMHINPKPLPKPKTEEKEIIPVNSEKHKRYLEQLRALIKRDSKEETDQTENKQEK